MHQNQWIAAAQELQNGKLEFLPVPGDFPQNRESTDVSYEYQNFSDGQRAADGPWAKGPPPDGNGQFSYMKYPGKHGANMPEATVPDPRLYGTTTEPKSVKKSKGRLKDRLKKN